MKAPPSELGGLLEAAVLADEGAALKGSLQGSQSVSPGLPGCRLGRVASCDFGAGYLHGAPALENAEIPVIWCERLRGNILSSWIGTGKEVLKMNTLCWSHGNPRINGAGTLADFSRAAPRNGAESGPQKLRWLVQMTHVAFSRLERDRAAATSLGLTERELEVMKWTADGKSAQDVADILLVSRHTVEFHIKNSVTKLQAPNKTAAVVRAALLGLLS